MLKKQQAERQAKKDAELKKLRELKAQRQQEKQEQLKELKMLKRERSGELAQALTQEAETTLEVVEGMEKTTEEQAQQLFEDILAKFMKADENPNGIFEVTDSTYMLAWPTDSNKQRATLLTLQQLMDQLLVELKVLSKKQAKNPLKLHVFSGALYTERKSYHKALYSALKSINDNLNTTIKSAQRPNLKEIIIKLEKQFADFISQTKISF